MRIVAKYTLLLSAVLALTLALLTIHRVREGRARLVADMQLDHRVVGRVIQAGVADAWNDVVRGGTAPDAARRDTRDLIQRANENEGMTRFEWLEGPQPAVTSQTIEGHDYVSRFPVLVGTSVVGTVVARESLAAIDRQVRSDIAWSAAGMLVIVLASLLCSMVMGRWLVGRPIRLLVDQARRIAHRDFSQPVMLQRADELGELAVEMATMSSELARATAATRVETEARIRAVEQLRHSDRLSTVGRLAAGIAHELGTPLSIVAGHAQMIAGREVTGDGALASAVAIDQEATRMGRIVRELLDFARRKGPEGSSCDPLEVVRNCTRLMTPMFDRARVRCEIAPGAASARALIDEDSVKQILTNLFANAVDAMPAGGTLAVDVTRVLAAAPDASEDAPRPCVRIEVRDTGTGIPPDVVPHVFEPFFTTKPAGDGTGLGLAVVYGIVIDHSGWITVESTTAGTTFAVYLHQLGQELAA